MDIDFNHYFVYLTPKLDNENNNDKNSDLEKTALINFGGDLGSAMKLFGDFCSKQFFLEKGYYYAVISVKRVDKSRSTVVSNWDRDYYGKETKVVNWSKYDELKEVK